MWNSKMAARWTGIDGNLNAGNSDFPPGSTPSQLVLSRHDDEGGEVGTQYCMDHSILAIFEDPAVTSEDKTRSEEESETLLSALTEMLDSVGDDEGTLSPFDTLPDTKLLVNPELRDNTVELSLAERLRPRAKAPNITLTIKIDEKKENESKTEGKSPPQLHKQQSQTLFHPKNKKTDAEVEVFTSNSLANLVKIMHSYCLRLHAEEEGDKPRKNHMLFSQEEVWKYERPTEESDEEINVVSDDEIAGKDTKEEEKRDRGQRLKSVLLNGNSPRAPPPREKKRVSFGPVQVSSYEESAEKSPNERNLSSGHTAETVSVPSNSTRALEHPAGSALETQTPSSEMNGDKAEVVPPRGETKAKALSLQQYRQLRRKRQPLVEKQGNYTTKWPSVSEPPKELTPILCLQGPQQNGCGPKTAHQFPGSKTNGTEQLHRYKTQRTSAPPKPHPPETKPSTPPRRSGLKRPRTESKIVSPAGRVQEVTTDADVGPQSKKSPVKKQTLVSSDPPNPVLLPLPASQISPSSSSSSPTDFSSSNSKVEFLHRDSNLDSTAHFQHGSSGTSPLQQPSSFASGFSESPTTQIQSSSISNEPQTRSQSPTQEPNLEPKSPVSPSPDPLRQIKCPSSSPLSSQPPTPSKEESSLPPQFGCGEQSASDDSGIEAPDLTSLLEQFEETQAKEESVQPKCPRATSPSNLPTDGQLDRAEPVGTERPFTEPLMPPVEALKPLSTSESPGSPKTLRDRPHLRVSEGVDIPEPLGTDIILSTQPDLQAKRKNPPSKAIQIIDPRPLPSRKTHSNFPESPAAHTAPHIYSSISSDHDYCAPLDRSSDSQCSRAPNFKDVSKTTEEPQAAARNSSSVAAESKKQTSAGEEKTSWAGNESAKNVTQRLPEEPGARPAPNPSDPAAPSDAAATERDRGRAAEDQRELCVLPAPPVRGRNKRRYRRTSPRSDSSSSSCSSSSSSSSSASRSPKRQKRRHRRSESSSCSSSPSRSPSRSPPRRYRWSYSRSRCSRSRSRSWSQSRSPSRSRSPSPRFCRRQWRDVYRSRESRRLRREHEMRIQKLKAIDERRVVYVGRICRSMTHDELRERFAQFGEVECVSLHFREKGDHYGFVTFYNMDDAFAAIDNGGKLRRPDELPFDLCFGGRRQFCNSDYADLDANRDADPCPAKSRIGDLDFDSLLKQAQKGLKR